MFGKLLNKNSSSNNFMQNLSSIKKDNKAPESIPVTSSVSDQTKTKIMEQGKNLGVKTVASNKFVNMINKAHANTGMGDLQDIQSRLKERDETKKNLFEENYALGLLYMKEFLKENNSWYLGKAIDSFTDAFNCKKTHPGPHFYLSHIAVMGKDKRLAEKYFKSTMLLDKNFPGLNDLRKRIYA